VKKPYLDIKGLSLVEVLVAFGILLVAVLTIVGFTAMIHRAAHEGKRQAIASMEAKSVIELLKDSEVDFVTAATGAGYVDTKTEYLLTGEANSADNEVGRQSAAQFQITARANHISGDIYGLVVRASWLEDGRPRQVVLESRTVHPGR
jgi:Tfp pilus assembly protein PilV